MEENIPQEEGIAEQTIKPQHQETSIIRKSDTEGEKVPLWLITFTDVMALMLTFFVLLYAMSEPQEEKWDNITRGLSSKFEQFDAKTFNAGSQDVINIDKISTSKALPLTYLKTLTAELMKEKNIEGVSITENGKRLVISLPSELLFNVGAAEISLEGKKLLYTLGDILSRIKNNIEITGHSDPTPMNADARFTNNWQLSLARAAAVASMFRSIGYDRAMTVRGLSSGRFDEMPQDLSQEKKFELSRRVDIIVLDHDGYRFNAFNP